MLVSLIFAISKALKSIIVEIVDPNGDTMNNNGTMRPVAAITLWNNFLMSKQIGKILSATKAGHLPKNQDVWDRRCREACEIWEILEEENQLNNDRIQNSAFPVLCLLIKGAFYFQINSRNARDKLFAEAPSKNLIHAAVSCQCLPASFMKKLVETHGEFLLENDNRSRRTPLHRICLRQVTIQQVVLGYNSSHHENEDYIEDNTEDDTDDDTKDFTKDYISPVEMFARACPKTVSQVDAKGNYPLYDACKSQLTWSTGIQALVELAPHIVSLERNGQTPFIMTAMAYAKRSKVTGVTNKSLLSSGGKMSNKSDQNVKKDGFTKKAFLTRGKNKSQESGSSPKKSALTPEQNRILTIEVTETLYGLLRHDPNVLKHLCKLDIAQ